MVLNWTRLSKSAVQLWQRYGLNTQSAGNLVAISVVVLFALPPAAALAADSVVQDVSTGEWVFTVTDAKTNQQKVWRYMPRNQFQAKIKQTLRWNGSQFEYDYRIHNDKKSKQEIAFVYVEETRMQMRGVPAKDPRANDRSLPMGDQMDFVKKNREALDTYKAQYISKIPGWMQSIGIDKQNIGRQFGWFPTIDFKSTVPNKQLERGQTLRGAYILRPELPGVGLATMMGDTDQRGRAQGIPDTGPLADAWEVIEATDAKVIPVLAPSVAIPSPYSGAALAKNLQDEVNAWPKLEVASQEVVDKLNLQFALLIPALESNNKPNARKAAIAMFEEVFGHHRGLNHRKFDQDDDEHDCVPLPIKDEYRRKLRVHADTQEHRPENAKLHRVAARALGFNLMYLLTRMEIGR